jgi:hypothetical protein
VMRRRSDRRRGQLPVLGVAVATCGEGGRESMARRRRHVVREEHSEEGAESSSFSLRREERGRSHQSARFFLCCELGVVRSESNGGRRCDALRVQT